MAPISPAAVDPYVDAFQKFPDLKSNGFSFLIDASSKLFTKAKPSLKDVEVNIEARNTALEINRTVLFLFVIWLMEKIAQTIRPRRILRGRMVLIGFYSMIQFLRLVLDQAIHAVMLATKGRGRFSSHLLKSCILTFFEKERLFPKGIVKEMECVQSWSLKMGRGLQRLVS